MKKTVICNVPMRENVDRTIYTSTDLSLPTSSRAVRFPINAFLEETCSNLDKKLKSKRILQALEEIKNPI